VTEEQSDSAARDADFSLAPSLPVQTSSHRLKQSKHPTAPDVPVARKREWGHDINWPKEWTTQGRLPGKSDRDPES
jgi:hypothetical protein